MEGPTGYLDATPDDKRLVILTGEETEMRHGGRVVIHDLDSGESRELSAHGDTVNALPLDQFLDRLESLTNYRVVADDQAPDGYRLEIGPFEGWTSMPAW